MQEIWVGTKAQAPNEEKPILRGLYKNEIRTADPTKLNVWYRGKKELNKEKLNERENAVGSEAQMTTKCYTLTSLPMMPRPGTQALVVSRADKIYISALFASSLVRNNISYEFCFVFAFLFPKWPLVNIQLLLFCFPFFVFFFFMVSLPDSYFILSSATYFYVL